MAGRRSTFSTSATRTKLRTIELAPNAGPHGLVWLEDGRLLATTERSQSLTIVDTRNGDRVSAISTGQQGTHMVAVSPDRRRAYTANIGSGTVSVLDLAAGTKLRDIAVGGQPEGIALEPRRAHALGRRPCRARGCRRSTRQASSGSPRCRTGAVPIRVAASPDGRWIVTSNLGCGCLTLIDARTRARVREIAVGGSDASRQVTILFSADGRLLYAAETGRNQIAEVELESGRVLRRLPAGAQGDGLAIAPLAHSQRARLKRT